MLQLRVIIKRGGWGVKKNVQTKALAAQPRRGGRRWRNVNGGRKSFVKEKKTHVPLIQNINSPLPAADLKGTGTCPRERGPLISPETRFVLLAFSSRVTCQSGERATLKWEGSTRGGDGVQLPKHLFLSGAYFTQMAGFRQRAAVGSRCVLEQR